MKYKKSSEFSSFHALVDVLMAGETVECCETDVLLIPKYLSGREHNGMVIGGCKPYYVSVMKKDKPVQKDDGLISVEDFQVGHFYTDPKSASQHIFTVCHNSIYRSVTYVSVNHGIAGYTIMPGKRYKEVVPTWK